LSGPPIFADSFRRAKQKIDKERELMIVAGGMSLGGAPPKEIPKVE